MSKFLLKNMGCKANQLEGCLIEENLINNGFQKTDDILDADYFILNSCTVTHKSDQEAFSIMHHIKSKNPNIKNILTGCIAQIEKQNLLENPNIDIVLGNDEKLEIASYLDSKCAVGQIERLGHFHKVFLQNTSKTRASLKIQDGCNNRCSYCIIPFARGQNRSADIDFILDQIKIYEDAGFKEIMLTGIHIGQWGLDNGKSLLHLLQNIEEKTNMPRFRLGSLNPLEINNEMIDFFKNSEKFCPHLHLSLQSMCDKTLKAMNRRYSVSRELELIDQIAEAFPLGFMGSDVIAGFPGETEENFEITLENLRKSKLTQIHTFPYSIRKGTVAEGMENQLDQKTKDNRANIIKEISAQKHSEFLKRNLGSTQEILIEKRLDRKTGMLKGVTRNYLNVLIDSNNLDLESFKRTLQTIKITKTEEQIYGQII